MEIRFWNRQKSCEQAEIIFGEGAIRWFYETLPGQTLTSALFSRRIFSRLYGSLQDSPRSARKIPAFIRDFEIPMEEYEESTYRSFNEFFIRKFRPGRRPFSTEPGRFSAFAEGRYLAYDRLDPTTRFPIKGFKLNASELLGKPEHARSFENGPAFIARLCPVDYHRYHYPDDGTTLDGYSLHGAYHSVNPIALAHKPDIFLTNERRVSILETRHFGKLAYVEVGALCVGKIVQSHDEKTPYRRGDEKGYFLFGGSTVVVLGEPGRWKPDSDLIERSAAGMESLIRLGEPVARAT